MEVLGVTLPTRVPAALFAPPGHEPTDEKPYEQKLQHDANVVVPL